MLDLEELEAVLAAYRDFDTRYTPTSIRHEYERRLIAAVPELIAELSELRSQITINRAGGCK